MSHLDYSLFHTHNPLLDMAVRWLNAPFIAHETFYCISSLHLILLCFIEAYSTGSDRKRYTGDPVKCRARLAPRESALTNEYVCGHETRSNRQIRTFVIRQR